MSTLLLGAAQGRSRIAPHLVALRDWLSTLPRPTSENGAACALWPVYSRFPRASGIEARAGPKVQRCELDGGSEGTCVPTQSS